LKNDQVYIEHILEAIAKIEKYTEKLDEQEFRETDMVQDAVVRQIEVIGEATKQLSDDKREEHSEIPWKDIAGMRDNLIHNYFGVDLEQVWQTVKQDIPHLKNTLKEQYSEKN